MIASDSYYDKNKNKLSVMVLSTWEARVGQAHSVKSYQSDLGAQTQVLLTNPFSMRHNVRGLTAGLSLV